MGWRHLLEYIFLFGIIVESRQQADCYHLVNFNFVVFPCLILTHSAHGLTAIERRNKASTAAAQQQGESTLSTSQCKLGELCGALE